MFPKRGKHLSRGGYKVAVAKEKIITFAKGLLIYKLMLISIVITLVAREGIPGEGPGEKHQGQQEGKGGELP